MKGRADDAGPDLPDYAPSPLVESVLVKLEEADAPESVCDEVQEIIQSWEWHKSQPYYGTDQHPDGYEGPCSCEMCLSDAN